MASSPPYRTSLLTATDCRSHVHLVVGGNPLAGKRCEQSLATGAKPILVTPDEPLVHCGLVKLVDAGLVEWRRQPFAEDLLFTLGRDEIGRVVDAVFVTTTASITPAGATTTAQAISALCKRNRIPVNVVDRPDLCSFSLLATHADGPLQVGITTNGRGCHLASRIRREVAAALPDGLGAACARLGEVRRRIIQEEGHQQQRHDEGAVGGGDGDGGDDADEGREEQAASFNQLVAEGDLDAAKNRRVRWLAQVCEYWPLKRLAAISDEDVETVLQSYPGGIEKNGGDGMNDNTPTEDGGGPPPPPPSPPTTKPRRLGRIILAGSGPGHPDLLTRATLKAIRRADLVLADKLVPAGVLDLVPRRTPVVIARKFPGNADRAQEELLAQALAGVRRGQTVLRLKQGDPFLYGRGGEEVAFFRAQADLWGPGGPGGPGEDGNDRVLVLPGVTSALSAPLFAGVPPTQRDVADQVLICTGTGKKGKPPVPPEYVASRTCVFLMALHRIGGLVAELTEYTAQELGQSPPPAPTTTTTTATQQQSPPISPTSPIPHDDDDDHHHHPAHKPTPPPTPTRALWPRTTPCAVIERASCPDQRVIRTTLARVAEAVEQEGSRPPGLLVVGRACEALYTPPPTTTTTTTTTTEEESSASGSTKQQQQQQPAGWMVEEGGISKGGWFLDDDYHDYDDHDDHGRDGDGVGEAVTGAAAAAAAAAATLGGAA